MQQVKYKWKRRRTSHFLGAAALFVALWALFRMLPGEDTGGLALLPAVTVFFCAPVGRREWLLALFAALAIAVVQLACLLVGFAVAGAWPPRGLTVGSDIHQTTIAIGMVLGFSIAFPTFLALGRQPVTPSVNDERAVVDLTPLQFGALTAGSLMLLFATAFAERLIDETVVYAPPGFAYLGFLIALWSGGITLVAWPQAGKRKRMLLTRSVLSVLIGLAGYFVHVAVYHRFHDPLSNYTPLFVLCIFVAVHIVALTLGGWQLKRFARRNGMLRLVQRGDGEATE